MVVWRPRLGRAVGQEATGAAVLTVGAKPAGVGEVDGVVVAVGVAVPLLGGGRVEDGVGADEAAGGGVVLAGAEVGEAGGFVLGAADEALGAGPGRGGGLVAAGLPKGSVSRRVTVWAASVLIWTLSVPWGSAAWMRTVPPPMGAVTRV